MGMGWDGDGDVTEMGTWMETYWGRDGDTMCTGMGMGWGHGRDGDRDRDGVFSLPSTVPSPLQLSVVEYDPGTHDLKTLSLHYFEEPELRVGVGLGGRGDGNWG